jgi:hypothetical protein
MFRLTCGSRSYNGSFVYIKLPARPDGFEQRGAGSVDNVLERFPVSRNNDSSGSTQNFTRSVIGTAVLLESSCERFTFATINCSSERKPSCSRTAQCVDWQNVGTCQSCISRRKQECRSTDNEE